MRPAVVAAGTRLVAAADMDQGPAGHTVPAAVRRTAGDCSAVWSRADSNVRWRAKCGVGTHSCLAVGGLPDIDSGATRLIGSRELVRDNQVIHVEDLHIAGMVRNRRLARAISDAGWGQFVQIIAQKADRYGRTLRRVSRWLASSKTCSFCGHRLDELAMKIRQWTCPSCQAVHDRDHNAAKVILAAGRAERRNASHASGRSRDKGSGGAHVRPHPVVALSDEAGNNPTAA
jgi:IS605 OrfB family transposase